MNYFFYKHTLKYTLVLHELESFFTKRTMFITNNDVLTQEFINSPNYVTSSYCNHLLNERLSNESIEDDPIFVDDNDNNINDNDNNINDNDNNINDNDNNIDDNDNNIGDLLDLDPNKNYYSNSYSDSKKLYGDYDDWKDYVDSVYNWKDYVENIYN
jgi:hypothetical protein